MATTSAVEIPLLSEQVAAPDEVVLPVIEQPAPEPTPRATSSSGGGRRLLADGLGGAGLIAIGVGGYVGVRARSSWNQVESLCVAADAIRLRDLRDQTGDSVVFESICAGNLALSLARMLDVVEQTCAE